MNTQAKVVLAASLLLIVLGVALWVSQTTYVIYTDQGPVLRQQKPA